jgi:predicted DNA-binding ribbon-helix-helix protein
MVYSSLCKPSNTWVIMSKRNELGRFETKGHGNRSVRSIRVDDFHWEKMGIISDMNDISRGDLLEKMIDEKRTEILPLIEEIDNQIEKKIKEIIEELNKRGDNRLKIPSKEKAIARRTLEALIEYLN